MGNNIFAGLSPMLLHAVVNQCMSLLDSAVANYLPELEEELGGDLRIVVQNSYEESVPFSEVIILKYPDSSPTESQILYKAKLSQGIADMLVLMKEQWAEFGMLEGIASGIGISTDKMAGYSDSLTKYIDILSNQYAAGSPVRIILLSYENAGSYSVLVNLQMQEAGGQWVGMLIEGKKANYWLSQLAEKVRTLIDKAKK